MNPNIALGIQRPRFNAPEDQANALAIQNSRMQQQANALALQKTQADMQRTTARQNALANAPTWKERAAVELQYGDPKAAMEIERYLADKDENARKAKLGEFKVFEQAAPLLVDASTYDQGRAMLAEFAPTIAGRLPEQFTPELVPNVERMALGIKGWKEQQGRDATAARADRDFNYRQSQDRINNALDERRVRATESRQGMTVFGPDGNPIVQMGGSGTVTAPTRNTLEADAIKFTDRLTRLQDISADFSASGGAFQELGTRWKNYARAAGEKMGVPLGQGAKDELMAFSQYRRNAYNELNSTLREMSGAAVTPQEADRLLATIPNPGKSLFDGDSPTEFKTKLDTTVRDVRRALVRRNWAMNRGVDPLKSGVSLSDVDAIIDRRGDELEAEFMQANPNADPAIIEAQVRDRLRAEGLDL